MLSLLDESVVWDALLVQELAEATRTEEEVQSYIGGMLGGHILYTNPHKPWDTAVVLHRRWAQRRKQVASNPFCVAVVVEGENRQRAVFASGHLPSQRGHTDDEYHEALEATEVLLRGLQRPGSTTVLGVDANAQLEDERGGLPGRVVQSGGAVSATDPGVDTCWRARPKEGGPRPSRDREATRGTRRHGSRRGRPGRVGRRGRQRRGEGRAAATRQAEERRRGRARRRGGPSEGESWAKRGGAGHSGGGCAGVCAEAQSD